MLRTSFRPSLSYLHCAIKITFPPGMASLFAFSTACTFMLAVLAYVRAIYPASTNPVTIFMFVVFAVSITGLFFFGRRFRWLPSASAFGSFFAHVRKLTTRRNALV